MAEVLDSYCHRTGLGSVGVCWFTKMLEKACGVMEIINGVTNAE